MIRRSPERIDRGEETDRKQSRKQIGSQFFFIPICEQAPEGADLKERADQTRSGQPDRRFSRAIRVEPGALRGTPDG